MSDRDLHRPAGSLAAGRWAVDLDPGYAGWAWTSLRPFYGQAGAGPGGTV